MRRLISKLGLGSIVAALNAAPILAVTESGGQVLGTSTNNSGGLVNTGTGTLVSILVGVAIIGAIASISYKMRGSRQ